MVVVVVGNSHEYDQDCGARQIYQTEHGTLAVMVGKLAEDQVTRNVEHGKDDENEGPHISGETFVRDIGWQMREDEGDVEPADEEPQIQANESAVLSGLRYRLPK